MSIRRRRIARVFLIFMAGFGLMFTLRFIYGYTSAARSQDGDNFISDFFESAADQLRKNYASDKFSVKGQGQGAPISVDQKFEKIGAYRVRTAQFSEDERKARALVKQHQAVIQFEQNSGNPGNRTLHLSIGVPPASFDSMTAQVAKLGLVTSANVTKVDKTSEYKDLNARRVSLENTRASLVELKRRNGDIGEFIALDNRILEIDSTLQGLGVALGEYAEENEFCTVRLTLQEGKKAEISLLHRLKVAFEWTVQFYLGFCLIVLLASGSAFILVLIAERLRILPTRDPE
ncbi:MAG: DUF4349 domain-containing protein [Bernardetiaceae bacterium]|jgi:hypothetical protein|nr:DUF4349 domain-containing protein [Bernardetiaceae bacterium]